MTDFTWTTIGSGDWSTAANWTSLEQGEVPPPGAGDIATFDDLTSNYTVNVTTNVDVSDILIDTSTSTATISISGSLTTDRIVYFSPFDGTATSMTVNAGGSLDITTLLDANSPETITIAGTEGGGRLVLGNPTDGDAGNNITFAFANTSPTALNTGVIQIDDTGDLFGGPTTQTITDVANGNEFVIPDENFAAGDTATLDTATHELTVAQGGTTVFTMNNIFLEAGATNAFTIVGTDIIQAVCYARGTMIRTPDGELPVEKLRPGKQVVTLVDGQEISQTVTWLGHRRIGLAGHPRPETVAPIRIQRDAFADCMPHRDLVVSPDHAIFVDGTLICARQLVNGTTIRQETGWTAVDYYHVELDQHAILLAEGLPAESYIDTGNSGFFANSSAPMVLHPDLTDETDYPTREAGSCVPFVWDEASVRPVWQRLADRAAAIGRPLPQHTTTADGDLRLLAAKHRTIKPIHSDSNLVIFMLPRGASGIRLLSRSQSPTEARPWLDDRRRLGVRVARIVLRGADEVREVPVDHPGLTEGWWAIERDGQVMSRWTDGDAVLPLPAMSGSVMLEIRLAGTMTYVLEAATEDQTERRAA
jgi:Hint domain